LSLASCPATLTTHFRDLHDARRRDADNFVLAGAGTRKLNFLRNDSQTGLLRDHGRLVRPIGHRRVRRKERRRSRRRRLRSRRGTLLNLLSVRQLRSSPLATTTTTALQVGMMLIDQHLISLEHCNLRKGTVSLD
jgi:hypothetical protein